MRTRGLCRCECHQSSCHSGRASRGERAPGADSGSSWTDAYNDLQDALAIAVAGDEIRVAEGLYLPDRDATDPDGSGNRGASFHLINGVAIRGGYAGYGASEPNARDAATYETILSGDLAGDDGPNFTGDDENSLHVVFASNGVDATATLDGFTITAGNANGDSGNSRGGGLSTSAGSPTVANCTFRGNAARGRDADGGGFYTHSGSPRKQRNGNRLHLHRQYGGR